MLLPVSGSALLPVTWKTEILGSLVVEQFRVVKSRPLCFEPKCNVKTEFGIQRNQSFIALLGKGGRSRLKRSKLPACPEEGAGRG